MAAAAGPRAKSLHPLRTRQLGGAGVKSQEAARPRCVARAASKQSPKSADGYCSKRCKASSALGACSNSLPGVSSIAMTAAVIDARSTLQRLRRTHSVSSSEYSVMRSGSPLAEKRRGGGLNRGMGPDYGAAHRAPPQAKIMRSARVPRTSCLRGGLDARVPRSSRNGGLLIMAELRRWRDPVRLLLAAASAKA